MPNDLWDALSQAAMKKEVRLPADVNIIMASWTLQKGKKNARICHPLYVRHYFLGYPVVTLTRDYSTQKLIITQVIATV